jgi:hypothetical protein
VATYRVQGPDGTIHKFEGPDDATPEQITAFAQKTFASASERPTAADQGSALSNLGAGAKIAVQDAWNGLKQRSEDFLALNPLGPRIPDEIRRLTKAASQLEVANKRAVDKPVLDTTAGKVGNIGANIGLMLPTAFIPGANTLAGAALIGGVSGLMQPSTSDSETAGNTGMGAVTAPAAVLAGRGLAAGYQGAKALVRPFTEKGQAEIVGQTLNRFASDPAAAAGRMGAPPLVPGSVPTVAEIAADPGLAQLQRSVLNASPGSPLWQRGLDQQAARLAAVRNVAGEAGKRDFFAAGRQAASEELYGKAFATGVNPKAVTPAVTNTITDLVKRPAMQEAMKDAQRIALNQGVELTDATSLQGLHFAKLSLDDMLGRTGERALGKAEKAGIQATREKLVGLLDKLSPAYAEARATHAAMSRPINQMDIGEALYKKLSPAVNDFGGMTRESAAGFTQALRDSAGTASRATGFKGATLENTLDPEQLRALTAVAQDLARKVNAQELGRATGSNTAQNLVGQNILESIIGPLGAPKSFVTNALAESLLNRPVSFLAGPANKRIQEALAESLLDPAAARSLMLAAQRQGPSLLGAGAQTERFIAPLTASLLH